MTIRHSPNGIVIEVDIEMTKGRIKCAQGTGRWRNSMFIRSVSISLALLASVAPSAPAVASDTAQLTVSAPPRSGQDHPQTVSYGDLDISTQSGAKTLLARIQKAAKHACIDYPRSSMDSKANFDACVSNAVGQAVAALNNPIVTALASGQQAPAG
jgi:UrcA family protein